jgi:KDO2-lipid IV(A) lauroyltransferase
MLLKRLAGCIGRMPQATLETLGRGIGHVAYMVDIRHRRIVLQNLAFIYPHMDLHQMRRMARRIFQHFGIVLLEILQAPFLEPTVLMEKVRVEGLEQLAEVMNNPRGCLLYSAHLGNWELGFLALSARLNHPVTTVAKPIKLQMAHAWLTALRARFGNRVVFKDGALPFMIRALRKGETVALLIDQGVRRKEAVEVAFFGKHSLATPAAALLGLRCRVPVVPLFCVRGDDGYYTVKVYPPVGFERSASLRRDIAAFTQKLLNILEDVIKEYPEQWFWFHKRWKRTHPALYPEYREQQRKKRLRKGRGD